MQHLKISHIPVAMGAFFTVTTIGLWSWNTLADLFGMPDPQFKHALAAIALLAILRLLVTYPLRRHAHDSTP